MALKTGNVKGISKGFIVLVQRHFQLCSQASDTLRVYMRIVHWCLLIATGKRKEHNVGRGFFGIDKLQYHTRICVAVKSGMYFISEIDHSVTTWHSTVWVKY